TEAGACVYWTKVQYSGTESPPNIQLSTKDLNLAFLSKHLTARYKLKGSEPIHCTLCFFCVFSLNRSQDASVIKRSPAGVLSGRPVVLSCRVLLRLLFL